MANLQQPCLVVAGMSNVDHIWQVERFPPVRSRTHAGMYRIQGGGPAATAAAAAARLGARTKLVSVHGDDESGRFALSELERYGVECSSVAVTAEATTPVSAVLVTPDGERFIFPYRDTERLDDPGHVDLSLLAGAHCLLTDFRYPRISQAVLTEARRLGVATVGDFGNGLHWHLARHVDYLLVSEECAAEVAGGKPPREALPELRQFDEQVVGITLGGAGFLYDEGNGPIHLPAFVTNVVDTTGAGDVFHGAYAYAVACGWDAARCGRLAAAAAALSCEGLGRASLATLQQVEARLASGT